MVVAMVCFAVQDGLSRHLARTIMSLQQWQLDMHFL